MSDGERNDAGESLKEPEKYDELRQGEEKDVKAEQGKDGEDAGGGNVDPVLDEDGDLDVTHRYVKNLLSQQLKRVVLLCERV